MKKTIIKIVTLLSIVSGLLFAPSLALAAPIDCSSPTLTSKQQVQCGSCEAAGATVCDPSTAPATVNGTVKSIINVLTIVTGAVAVIMIIVGGFRYVTSSGNPESAKSARNTIVYALIGLVIVAMAQLIVFFVLNKAKPNLDASPSNPTSSNSTMKA